MIEQNRVVPFLNPIPSYDPPTIVISSEESADETINDVLDRLDESEIAAEPVARQSGNSRGKRRDTEFMHNEVKVSPSAQLI